MTDGRPIKAVFTCNTNPVVTEVYLAVESSEHISQEHGEAVTDEHVATIVTDPTHIHQSKKATKKPTVILTNSEVTTPSGKPLAVFVKLEGDGVGLISTAFPAQPNRFGNLIWAKEGGDVS